MISLEIKEKREIRQIDERGLLHMLQWRVHFCHIRHTTFDLDEALFVYSFF